MKNTKTIIRSTARSLFNKHGYSHVTIRMIAIELKMSSGNLNYHFKKREDILEALYFEMVKDFDDRIERLDSNSITMSSIRAEIHASLTRMVAYRFFWTDLYNLLRSNPKIKAHFDGACKDRFQGSQLLFKILIEKDLMRQFEFSGESALLTERMISFGNTCLYNSFLYDHELDDRFIETQADHLFLMLYPYLTDQGKAECRVVSPGYFL